MRTTEYFTLAFGTMVGVGWLVVMDDWLRRGSPLGAMLGFAIASAALLPIGYVYGKPALLIPDAGSEINRGRFGPAPVSPTHFSAAPLALFLGTFLMPKLYAMNAQMSVVWAMRLSVGM